MGRSGTNFGVHDLSLEVPARAVPFRIYGDGAEVFSALLTTKNCGIEREKNASLGRSEAIKTLSYSHFSQFLAVGKLLWITG